MHWVIKVATNTRGSGDSNESGKLGQSGETGATEDHRIWCRSGNCKICLELSCVGQVVLSCDHETHETTLAT